MKLLATAVVVVAALAVSCASAPPQTASIHGVVTANDAAPLPGVTIEITSSCGVHQQLSTSESGSFSSGEIPVDCAYAVRSWIPGFADVRIRAVRLPLHQPLSIRMEPTVTQVPPGNGAEPPRVLRHSG
jgi:hypothetical protein